MLEKLSLKLGLCPGMDPVAMSTRKSVKARKELSTLKTGMGQVAQRSGYIPTHGPVLQISFWPLHWSVTLVSGYSVSTATRIVVEYGMSDARILFRNLSTRNTVGCLWRTDPANEPTGWANGGRYKPAHWTGLTVNWLDVTPRLPEENRMV